MTNSNETLQHSSLSRDKTHIKKNYNYLKMQ